MKTGVDLAAAKLVALEAMEKAFRPRALFEYFPGPSFPRHSVKPLRVNKDFPNPGDLRYDGRAPTRRRAQEERRRLKAQRRAERLLADGQ